VASRLAEEVVESSGVADASPFVAGDVMVDRCMDSFLEVIEGLESIPLDQLPPQAMRILGRAGSVTLKNGELMRSLIAGSPR